MIAPSYPLQASEIPVADDPVVLVIGSLYILLILAIGVWGYLRTDTLSDFLITGKSIGTWVLAITIFSVTQSGFGFVGGPELIYTFGLTPFWIFGTASFGFLVTWMLLGKRMRLLADIRDVMTLPDGMYARYESNWVRGLTAVTIIVAVTGYLATNLAALQYVMQAIFGIPVLWGLVIGSFILLLYSAIGGMIAGVWTDFVQGITMVGGAVLVFVYALSFGGGPQNISENLAAADPALVSPFGALGGVMALSWWILFSIGGLGQAHTITKFYMIKDIKLLRWGAPIAAISYGISSLLAFTTGLSMRAMVESGNINALESASQTMPIFVLDHTPSIVAGLVLSGLLAAIMSTSDSFLNIAAAAVTRDIPRSLGRPIEDSQLELRITQATLVGITLAATGVVYFSEALVGILGVIGWGLFAASLFPVVALGLNWKGATAPGAIAASVVGLSLNIIYEVLPTAFSTIGMSSVAESVSATYPFPQTVVVGAAAMLLSTIVFIVVSLATQSDYSVPADIRPLLEQ
ncbi:sodium/proline symporter [Natrinema sp. 1APR25-10V2]|uniref:sodium/proline symporter n=1 Tax=Natrinema sp. 1APR25-10V2 TaxID=2951081 RepID=UPI002876AE79|nr:sodium/proline symporter [Natrinema sp. 1APR25-10V2]MDS0476969.1 sodium/proline symporter [Natrinema sp. 1APR25-10V2]